MAEWDTDVKVIGIDDLEESMQKLVKRYPDRAGECLRAEALKTRKEIVKNAKDLTETNTTSKMSLGRIGSYRVSQVQGLGINQYVEISARSPHYHLVERGHQIILPYTFTYKNPTTGERIKRKWSKGGQSRGRVAGRFFLKKAKDTEQERFPEFVSEMIDDLLKESGF